MEQKNTNILKKNSMNSNIHIRNVIYPQVFYSRWSSSSTLPHSLHIEPVEVNRFEIPVPVTSEWKKRLNGGGSVISMIAIYSNVGSNQRVSCDLIFVREFGQTFQQIMVKLHVGHIVGHLSVYWRPISCLFSIRECVNGHNMWGPRNF